MTDGTRPVTALGTKVFAAALATALLAMLALAPLASAGIPDPIASGTTTVTLNKGTVKQWKKRGVKISLIKPATLSGTKATFTVKPGAPGPSFAEGSLDPIEGRGAITLNGGLKFKAGKKSTTVRSIVLDTSKRTLFAAVGGQKIKMATFISYSVSRNGFGINLTIRRFSLTKAAARKLNTKLGYRKNLPFKANQVLGSGAAETEPLTVSATGGNLLFAPDPATIAKLAAVGVDFTVNTVGTEPKPGEFAFPLSPGGTISPFGTAGKVESGGGITLTQQAGGMETRIELFDFTPDYAAKTVSVEVTAKSTASKDLNLGSIGRTSIADITAVGGVNSDAPAHRVSITGTTASLQQVSAAVLNGFSLVAEAGEVQELIPVIEGDLRAAGQSEAEAKEHAPPLAKQKAAEDFANKHIKEGDPLGTFSFAAQVQ